MEAQEGEKERGYRLRKTGEGDWRLETRESLEVERVKKSRKKPSDRVQCQVFICASSSIIIVAMPCHATRSVIRAKKNDENNQEENADAGGMAGETQRMQTHAFAISTNNRSQMVASVLVIPQYVPRHPAFQHPNIHIRLLRLFHRVHHGAMNTLEIAEHGVHVRSRQ